MKNWKNIQKSTPQKKQLKKELRSQSKKQRRKFRKNRTYFGKNAETVEKEEYVEVSVTYEVIENIGMQEKIEEENIQTEETQ